MEFVSIDTWSLIFTWVNLFILFLIMKKLLFKPVMNMIESREKEVGEMYEKAESAALPALSTFYNPNSFLFFPQPDFTYPSF